MKRTIEIDLQYQNPIMGIPPQYGDPYKTACSGDTVTIESWRNTWIKQYKEAKDYFGTFGDKSYGQLHGINRHQPMIVCGSGPSLKNSLDALRKNQASPHPVKVISCLHNFGYFLDEGIKADYYLTLDAGSIVLQDVVEARSKDPEYYWEMTKDATLIASVCTPVELFKKWKGKLYLFNTLIPDMSVRAEFEKVEKFTHYISTGGNASGGCMYAAKALMGSSDIIYVGVDLCFDYDSTFHSYKTHYDNFDGKGIGDTMPWPDVYGIRRRTWPSYFNFAQWFNFISMKVPGTWSTASEGILGAYPEGNLNSFRYGTLSDLLEKYRIADTIQLGEHEMTPEGIKPRMNEDGTAVRRDHLLSEFFKDPQQPMEIVLF